ncbi:MAG: D-alanine--D-alanine ligase [SAR86 cluster bacterium]|uniref:D-alanine--D-alanine ligase n=1 Tax=SAR86 cluster bacterium TaxID=2030880 RepID=A0A2A5B132_9GAMM|nr:MAG: D-alanine--D-alanine ligase [SAR86 cluster bacterium]
MRTIDKEKIVGKSGHVVVLKGGASVEREISLLSGDAVFQGLKRLGVRASVLDASDELITQLKELSPDLVFIMLHGQGGEDGIVQGLLESMKLKYTGSRVLASALAMDKVKAKLIWQQLGLSTADFTLLNSDTNWEKVIAEFGEVIVKPVNGGSSLGMLIVSDAESLQRQYEVASTFDSAVMVEKCIVGNEYSVGVIDDHVLPTVQLRTKRDFFDFDAKYIDEDTETICPPELTDVKQRELNTLVKAAFNSLGCRGLARVDVMQDSNEKFYLLEVNTVPGMTSHSFVPLAAEKSGIDFDQLLLRILHAELALG